MHVAYSFWLLVPVLPKVLCDVTSSLASAPKRILSERHLRLSASLRTIQTSCDTAGAKNSGWIHTVHHPSPTRIRGVRSVAAMPATEAEPTNASPQQQQENIEALNKSLEMASLPTDPLKPNVPKRLKPGTAGSSTIPNESAAFEGLPDGLTGSSAHPAMDAMPLIEKYMKLRASGHHVSDEEEALIINSMLARATQVDQFESVGPCLVRSATCL